LPNAYTLDVAGPLTRCAADAGLAMNVLAGFDPADPTSLDLPAEDFTVGLDAGVKGLRIGLLRRFHERDFAADPKMIAAFEATAAVLRDLGATLVEVDVPYPVQQYRDCMRPISSTEALSIHGPDVREKFALMGRALQENSSVPWRSPAPNTSPRSAGGGKWRRPPTLPSAPAMPC
jgi:aspartyl-tRNA(Asn)/glutamyl-tRNA(Gln) amidotransferase subunit A